MNNKSYLATEPVYDNLMGDLGANNKLIQFSEAVEQGNDPSAKTVRNWQNLINKGEISLVINNLQTKGKVVNNALKYAKKNKIPVINVTETKPKGQSYVQWQTKQLKQVIAALETN